jgi:hypothetical protein
MLDNCEVGGSMRKMKLWKKYDLAKRKRERAKISVNYSFLCAA